jgi:heat shock protein HslJ
MEVGMKNRMSSLLLILIMGLMLASCSHPNNTLAADMESKNWELKTIRTSVPIAGRVISIEFEDGEVHGSSGCNSYFGGYEIKGDEITFGMLASTEMACMDPEGLMGQEQDYLSFLSEVVSFSIEDGQLILRKADQDQLTFSESPQS